MTYTIESITFSDCPSIAECSVTSFNEDPVWAAIWQPSVPLATIIADTAAHMPWRLIEEQEKQRHQKVVRTATGKIVGYAKQRGDYGAAYQFLMEDEKPRGMLPLPEWKARLAPVMESLNDGRHMGEFGPSDGAHVKAEY